MSEDNQFYADNEKNSEVLESDVDLSLAYNVCPNIIPEDQWEDQQVVFFCHDCGKLVKAEKKTKGMSFFCSECSGKKISFGTEKSVQHFFHLNDEGVQKK